MPKVASDYSKTIIYKLCCKDPTITEIYIGSTTNFSQRKRHHKDSCKYETDNNYNTHKSQFIRANGGFENWNMIQLEEYPCENKRAAEMRERYWIEQLQPKLNSNIPFRSSEELKFYYSEHKEQILEYHKQYREANKAKISEYKKQYREANKEQILEYQKQYREANKEQIIEKNKEYYEANKQKISQQRKQYRIKKKQEQPTTEII